MTSTIDEAVRPEATAPRHPGAGSLRRAPGPRGFLREHWPAFALAALAALLALLALRHIFPAYSYNRDEPVYRWMADHLRDGTLTPPDGGAPEFFLPWLSASRDGVFFTHFTVGWSAVLAAFEVVVGTHAAGPLFGAALIVLGTYALARELTHDRTLAVVAAAVMALSPIIPTQGGTYLGYLFSAGLGLLFAAGMLNGARRRRPLRIGLAGALLGVVLLTRPFDAVLWGLAVGAYLVLVQWRQWRSLLRIGAVALVGLVPFVALTLVYNQAVTGAALEMPNGAADPLDRFGFGDRRMMPTLGLTEYSPRRAVKSTLKNGVILPIFLAGSYVGLLAAGVGLWLRRRQRSTLALLAILAVFPATYFFHWGTFVSSLVSKWSGPIYFIPLYGPLAILVATTVLAAWRWRRPAGVGLVAVMAVATVPGAVDRLDSNREISIAQEPWRESVEGLEGRSLVFVARSGAYLQFFNPFSVNAADLDGELLYATDRGAGNFELIDRLDDRTPYLQRPTIPGDELSVPRNNPAEFPPGEMLPREDARVPEVSLTPIELVTATSVALELRAEDPDDAGAVVAFVDLGDGGGPQWQPLGPDGGAARWTVRAPGSGAEGLPLTGGRLGTLAVGVAYGDTAERARQADLRVLLHYRVQDGEVQVMLPADQQRRRTEQGRQAWFQAADLPELDLAVTPG